MAVTAPDSAAPDVNELAHAPVVPGASAKVPVQPGNMNGTVKREAESGSSDDDDKPLMKRARASVGGSVAKAGPSKQVSYLLLCPSRRNVGERAW